MIVGLASAAASAAPDKPTPEPTHVGPRPLVLTAGNDGYATLDVPQMTGRPEDGPVEIVGFLPHNPRIRRGDHGFVAVPFVDDDVPINEGIEVPDPQRARTLRLRPGYYYLDTNYGQLRIVVLGQGLSDMQRFSRLLYFYTSISAHGRSANDFTGENAVRIVFHSDLSPGNYCTGHVNLFISIFGPYLPRMRKVDFFAMRKDKDGSARGIGHSIVEVLIDGRWIVADPTFGFIPVDRKSKVPLSFVEFFERIPRGDYLLKYQYRVPILPETEEILAKVPPNEHVDHLTDPLLFANTWDAKTPTIFRYDNSPNVFFALPQHKLVMSPADWELFGKHYQSIFRKLHGLALAAHVNTNTSLPYGATAITRPATASAGDRDAPHVDAQPCIPRDERRPDPNRAGDGHRSG